MSDTAHLFTTYEGEYGYIDEVIRCFVGPDSFDRAFEFAKKCHYDDWKAYREKYHTEHETEPEYYLRDTRKYNSWYCVDKRGYKEVHATTEYAKEPTDTLIGYIVPVELD